MIFLFLLPLTNASHCRVDGTACKSCYTVYDCPSHKECGDYCLYDIEGCDWCVSYKACYYYNADPQIS